MIQTHGPRRLSLGIHSFGIHIFRIRRPRIKIHRQGAGLIGSTGQDAFSGKAGGGAEASYPSRNLLSIHTQQERFLTVRDADRSL